MAAPGPERIETERLILRPPALDDAPAIFERWAQDAETVRYLTWRPHATVEQTREFLRHATALMGAGDLVLWVLTLRGDDSPIGMLGLRRGRHGVEAGYVLGKTYWNRGYMTEALRSAITWAMGQPEVYRVWAVCDVENRPSARVLEKSGLRREGVLRRWTVHPNVSPEPRDCFCYSLAK